MLSGVSQWKRKAGQSGPILGCSRAYLHPGPWFSPLPLGSSLPLKAAVWTLKWLLFHPVVSGCPFLNICVVLLLMTCICEWLTLEAWPQVAEGTLSTQTDCWWCLGVLSCTGLLPPASCFLSFPPIVAFGQWLTDEYHSTKPGSLCCELGNLYSNSPVGSD